jgi:PleD family two-component response regulator
VPARSNGLAPDAARVRITPISLHRSPVVLIIDDQEWSARSLESVLMPNGFALLREFTAAKGLERARSHPPDIVVVARTLPDQDGFALCTALRASDVLGDRVPILVTMHERPPRAERLTALRAGAWDILAPPIDAEELVVRLETFVRAKFDGDRIRESGLLDPRTGFYNVNGLERRATELGAWARRQGEPLSCVILSVVLPEAKASSISADALVDVLRRTSRNSDAIGRTGQWEFAVVAPATDASQAVKLAERFAEAIRSGGLTEKAEAAGVQVRGGYECVEDPRETPLRGRELISRAATALARAKIERSGEWLKPFRLPPESRH